MKKIKRLSEKLLTKEVILYVVFGVLTTIINLGSFYIINSILKWEENISNIIAITLAVLFAYITNKDLVFHSEADTKKEKVNEFLKFICNTDSVLVVWGTSDIKELLKNIEFNKLSTSPIPKKYIDIQSYATKLFKLPKGQKIGLKKAVEVLEIVVDGEFHDAFFDAHYTSEVFKSIYNKKIIPQVYNKTLEKRPKVKKEKLDSKALINEFEKIYNRKMSKEEIQIIRLAYFMGKTKQFIIKDE